jgi:hypothetical protein
MAYDAETQKVVLFGGETAPNAALPSDTWVWDGSNWSIPTAVDQESK